MAIPLMRPTHPAEGGFTPIERAALSRAYLVLLRGEIAPFHPFNFSAEGLVSVALILPSRGMGLTPISAALWSPDFPPTGKPRQATIRPSLLTLIIASSPSQELGVRSQSSDYLKRIC